MTQDEIIEKIGFGCGGDTAETLFRAGFRAIRPSPFDDGEGTPIRDFVSWTGVDARAASEGQAVAATWRRHAEDADGSVKSIGSIFGKGKKPEPTK
jgi:hypothetical protein